MRNRNKPTHTDYLINLERRLHSIGEDRSSLVSIIREPIWFKVESRGFESLCDLILLYEDYAVPIELKGSKHKRSKAISQLNQGHKYCNDILGYETDYGIFVVYYCNYYYHEKIGK